MKVGGTELPGSVPVDEGVVIIVTGIHEDLEPAGGNILQWIRPTLLDESRGYS